jgi:FkbM family methyltransferase
MFVGGSFEPNEFAWLDTILRPGMTFVDVGANDGLYALFAAQRVGPQGKVLAIEPSQREFMRLDRNLRLNRLTNVRAFRLAASSQYGEATL